MTGYLGIGSNVGDRLANLRAAVRELSRHPSIRIKAASSVYETEPVGEVVDQRDFLNLALKVSTGLKPVTLLAACKEVEVKVGRAQTVRHGPRVIDVDLLLLGQLQGTFSNDEATEHTVTLPHPLSLARRFVLAPLLEIDPLLTHPDGTRLSHVLEALGSGQRVRKLGPLNEFGQPNGVGSMDVAGSMDEAGFPDQPSRLDQPSRPDEPGSTHEPSHMDGLSSLNS